jgi:hypothetical protein
MDILERDHDTRVGRYIYTGDTGHVVITPAANRTRRPRLRG